MSNSQPFDAGDYFELALNHEAAGRDEAAIDGYAQAIRLFPKFADAYYARGVLLLGRGEYALSVNDFDEALLHNSQNAMAYYQRGVAHYLSNDYERAVQDFDHVLAMLPNHELAREGHDRSLKKLGK